MHFLQLDAETKTEITICTSPSHNMAGEKAEQHESLYKKHRTAQTGQAVVKQKFIFAAQAPDDSDGAGVKQNCRCTESKQEFSIRECPTTP